MTPDWWKRCSAEGIATFGFTLVGAGAVCVNQYTGGELGLIGIALAHGTMLTAMIYAIGHVSGGHVNPAVTLAIAARGGIGWPLAGSYVAAQVLGAVTAGLLLARVFTPEVWQPAALGTPQLSPEVATVTGMFLEGVLTLFLVFTVLQVAVDPRAPGMVYGLAIGLVLVGGVLVGGPLTGAALNPARAIGPALASGVWDDQLVYWVGPMAGGLVAALAHGLVQPAERPGEAGDRPDRATDRPAGPREAD